MSDKQFLDQAIEATKDTYDNQSESANSGVSMFEMLLDILALLKLVEGGLVRLIWHIFLGFWGKRRAKPIRILDLGCGNGVLAGTISRYWGLLRFYRIVYTGLDNSQGVLSVAKNRWPSFRFECVDVCSDDPYDGEYDIFFSYWCLQHIPRGSLHRVFDKLYLVSSSRSYGIINLPTLAECDLESCMDGFYHSSDHTSDRIYWVPWKIEDLEHVVTTSGFDVVKSGIVPYAGKQVMVMIIQKKV